MGNIDIVINSFVKLKAIQVSIIDTGNGIKPEM